MINPSMIDNAMQRWGEVAPILGHARTEADYQALVSALDQVLDAGGADEHHPLALLAETLGERIAEWEARDTMPQAASGAEVLRHLMAEHGLRQSDLPEIGNQNVVSEVLNRRRDLNLRQIKALALRFRLPAELFL